MIELKWKRNDIGGVSSVDGRFVISPNYRHTVRPDSWTVRDTLYAKEYRWNNTQRDAKEYANRIVGRELQKAISELSAAQKFCE